MNSHVSYNGFLQKVRQVYQGISSLPSGARFISYGRLVNPKGNYADAPVVSLYQIDGGFIALQA